MNTNHLINYSIAGCFIGASGILMSSIYHESLTFRSDIITETALGIIGTGKASFNLYSNTNKILGQIERSRGVLSGLYYSNICLLTCSSVVLLCLLGKRLICAGKVKNCFSRLYTKTESREDVFCDDYRAQQASQKLLSSIRVIRRKATK